MSTIVDLYIGGTCAEIPSQVYTADLILTAPYTELAGNLLVLRSAPDVPVIAGIIGTLAVIEVNDHVIAEGERATPPEPITGALSVAGKNDSAELSGTNTDPLEAIAAITGTLSITEARDTNYFEGQRSIPPDVVTGTLSVTDGQDTTIAAGEFAPPGVTGVISVTEGVSTASFSGAGFAGLAVIIGQLLATEASDVTAVDATYLQKWVAVLEGVESTDSGNFGGAFLEYEGPGFLVVSEVGDTADFSGRVVYAVAGTVEAINLDDTAEIVARTAEILEAESTDTLLISEILVGDAEVVSLVDRVYISDLLDYSRDMVFADIAIASEDLQSVLQTAFVVTETLYSTDSLGVIYNAVTVDVVTATDSLQGDSVLDVDDVVIVTEDLASQSDISGALADQGIASDDLAVVIYILETTDTAIASDALDGTVLYQSGLAYSLAITESLSSSSLISTVSADQVTATDVLVTVFVGVTTDIVTASDVLDIATLYKDGLADSLAATDELASSSQISTNSVDQARFTEVLVTVFSGTATDTVTATETLESLITFESGLADSIVVAEDWLATITTTASLTDTVYARDALEASFLVEVVDTVTATDSLISPSIISAVLLDTSHATDSLLGEMTVYAPLLADQATVSEGLLGGLTLVGILSDTVWATDTLNETAAQTVLVVNAETGAVSTYQFTPVITGMAEYQGVLYLSGPEGLYALDVEQDADGDVVWTLRTGFSNLGTDRLKRVQDCNFQARTEGDTTFQVVSDRYGQKQEWNYRLPPLTRDSYRDGVVKVGRGVQSVYWQFAAEGIGPAEIDQLRLVVEPLSRRR